MPDELQAVLLRVLQDKQVMRVGGKKYLEVNFRLIAATNQDLWQLVLKKMFREDLYFRLSVLSIEIPPLKERGYDIAILANYFLEINAEKRGWAVPLLSEGAFQKIIEYDWPGNVRQLENAMIYAVNVADDGVINSEHLPKELFVKKDERRISHSDDSQEITLMNALSPLKDSEKIV
jgi:transcriptional regulator with PAS, ATPase and Fis domain